jgi:pimeloyl-ACP methyl ester carboxylesterase
VFVADGAGDFRAASGALRRTAAQEQAPLRVETFVWSHGYGRILSDQLALNYARAQGLRLAKLLADKHQAYPDSPLYLVGHSAGSQVVLAAAEEASPESIERIILLAPSVPSDYDLRPALRKVHQDIAVFCSPQEDWYLPCGMLLTSLRYCRFCHAAGTGGFETLPLTPEDTLCYKKLRHFPWEPRLAWTGHEGGHFGSYQPGFLKAFVLPLLAPAVLSHRS